MKVKTRLLALVSIAILLGGVLLASALGLWNTTNSRRARSTRTDATVGQANPADILNKALLNDRHLADFGDARG